MIFYGKIFYDFLEDRLKSVLPGRNAHKKMLPEGGEERLNFPINPTNRSAVLILFDKVQDSYHL